jgi:hypothetical protein
MPRQRITMPRPCQWCGTVFNARVDMVKLGRLRYCSGSCANHHRQAIARATRTVLPLEERFWTKVDKTGECWLWTAALHDDGYGMFGISGRSRYAHRLSFEFTHGAIPDGMQVLHHCDNPPCVNPAHLYLGTRADNMHDMVVRGRFASKVTADQVRVIRARAANGERRKQLAMDYSISEAQVKWIVKRKGWLHID